MSASLAKLFTAEGMAASLAARRTEKPETLCADIGAESYLCDACNFEQVSELFDRLDEKGRVPDLVVYNADFYTRGPIIELDPNAVQQVLMVNAFGAMLVAQAAAKRMLKKGQGVMLFTGRQQA